MTISHRQHSHRHRQHHHRQNLHQYQPLQLQQIIKICRTAEILITVISVSIVSMIIVYCCCKCNEQEDNNRW